MNMSDRGDWGNSADDDGSELIRTLSRLVPFSDDDVSSESEESSDEDLETVSEKRYLNDGKAASTYLAAVKKNLTKRRVWKRCLITLVICRTSRKSIFTGRTLCQTGPIQPFFRLPLQLSLQRTFLMPYYLMAFPPPPSAVCSDLLMALC